MKVILLALSALVCLSFIKPANPLAGTEWTAEDFVFQFTKADTVNVYKETEIVVKGIYTVKDSTLTWHDIAIGGMGCDPTIIGTYIYKIEKDKLSFTLVSDECDGRKEGLQVMQLTKK